MSAFPGPPAAPKVISASETCINLCWSAPSNTGRSRIQGYILEKRKKGSNLWTVVNASDETIKGLLTVNCRHFQSITVLLLVTFKKDVQNITCRQETCSKGYCGGYGI